MDFNLTEERSMLRDTLSRFLADKYDHEARRKLIASGKAYDAEIFAGLAELGVLGALFSEEQGGFGGAGVDLSVVFEELGRAGVIEPEVSGPVIVEGNYLLLDRPEWRALGPWALTVFLDVPMEELERRLSERWAGLEGEALTAKMEGNDLPNARLVVTDSVRADVTLRWPEDEV